MSRLSSDWESTRLKIELSPVQIREAALVSEFKCLGHFAGGISVFFVAVHRPRNGIFSIIAQTDFQSVRGDLLRVDLGETLNR